MLKYLFKPLEYLGLVYKRNLRPGMWIKLFNRTQYINSVNQELTISWGERGITLDVEIWCIEDDIKY